MAENIIKVRQKQRCDTEANWTSKNPVLLAGEIAISSDKTGLMKVGDGKSLWTAIPYSKASLSKTDVTTALGYTPPTTNTTYSIGTSSTAGIVKLYTGTGSNTDGSMTQAAIKSALNGKSGMGHTHNYAGSGSAGGSANSAVKLDTATAGSTTQPVYFSGGKPAVCTYTLGKSVPSNAVFTDTWRGIQNNLTSDSATDSLAAAQGKALKSLITDLSSKSFQKKTDTIINTTDWNTIKDPGCYKVQVATWGDATKLHSPNAYLSNLYQYGLLLVFRATDADTELRTVQIFMPHRSDSGNPVLTRMLNGSTWNAWSTIGRGIKWSEINGKPSTFTPSSHTHDDRYYTETEIDTKLKGKSGTDHTHTYIIDCGNNASKTTLAYSKTGLGYSEYTWLAAWNGYELRAVNKNQFATSGHTHSQYYDSTISRTTNTVLAAPNGSNGGATFRALMEGDLPRHNNPYYREFNGTSGQDGYIKIMTIKPTVAYQNQPMTFLFGQRGVVSVCRLSIEFTNAGSVSTTEVNSFTVAGAGMNFYIVKSSAGVFDVYVKKIDKYDSIVLYGYWKSSFMDSTTITFSDTQITSVPSGYVQAGWGETVNRSAVSNRTDNSIIVQLNGGSTEGTNKFTFNGSAAKTINITPSAIGASAVGHSHGVLEDPTKSGANTTNFVSLSYYAKELDDSTSDYVAVWNKKGNQIGTQSKSAFVLASRTYNVTSGTIYLPWDDTSARAKLPTIETLTRWNGAYDKNGGSVLAYCNQGAFANGATCNITYGTSAPTGSGKKGDIYIQIS